MKSFLLAIVATVALLFVSQLFRLGTRALQFGFTLGEVMVLAGLALTRYAVLLIPLSVLISCFVSFARLAADRELFVLDMMGYGPARLMFVPLLVALLATAASHWAATTWTPAMMGRIQHLAVNGLMRTATTGMRPQIFNQFTSALTVFYDRRGPQPNEMLGLFMYDGRRPRRHVMITAQRAVIELLPGRGRVRFVFHNGEIHFAGEKSGEARRVMFKTFRYFLDLSELIGRRLNAGSRAEEMTQAELRAQIVRYRRKGKSTGYLELTYASRYALPLSCILFAMLSVIGSYLLIGRGRGWTVLVIAVTALAYYLTSRAGIGMVKNGKLTPLVAAWAPNVIFFLICVALWYVARRRPA